jgi:hypothetical protein
MRAFFIALVLIAAIAGGGYYYWREHPEAFAPKADSGDPAPPPPPQRPRSAEACAAADARYVFVGDARLTLRFNRIPPEQESPLRLEGRQIGNLAFVVKIDGVEGEIVYLPENILALEGPQYELTALFVRPEAGGERASVSLFDTELRLISSLPRHDSQAPAFIYLPDLMRALYARQVDLPPAMFRYDRCEPAAAASGVPASTPPTGN